MSNNTDHGAAPRRLAPQDLDAVAAIDESIVGRTRRGYFERRLQAALRDPGLHVQFAVDRGQSLAGYMLARRLEGEFGRVEPALRLEVVGVRPDAQGQGIGDALLGALERWAKEKGVREIRTQASWRDHKMLRFFSHAGFQLAKNQIVDCEVRAAAAFLDRQAEDREMEAREEAELHPGGEVDYGAPPHGDFTALDRDRMEASLLVPGDAAEIARIDRHLVGRERLPYIEQAVKEAVEGSAVRVSLVARKAGAVAGYVMAKTDFGDYGRAEPVAVIDTIGVDPAFAKHGVGTALLSQLFVNLTALGVERVETTVSRENFGLLHFLYKVGFGSSQRLGFVKSVA
jgi:GNAT superfamily N-acetyltransferase